MQRRSYSLKGYHESQRGSFYAVPYVHSFLGELADLIVQEAGLSPLSQLKTLVILPTRRSCRHLKALVNQRAAASAIVPPLITTFSDLSLIPSLNLPGQPLDSWQALARIFTIVQQAMPHITDYKTHLDYAQTLLPLLEEWLQHQRSLEHFEEILPAHLAEHLQKNLALFYQVLTHFPLEQSRAHYQKMAFKALLDKQNGQRLIVVTEAPPDLQTIDFLVSCLQHKNAQVFLLGFNPAACGKSLSAPQPYHPHSGYIELLDRAHLNPAEVRLFNQDKSSAYIRERENFLWCTFIDDHYMPPADTSQMVADAFQDVSLIECATQHEEAATIAVILRESLETPHQKTAFITPDRKLAALVKAQLRRWKIEIDDSAGEPFFETATGSFLKLAAECIENGFEPLSLLGLLKHPYCSLGRPLAEVRRLTRQFEMVYLRQNDFPRPSLDDRLKARQHTEIVNLLADLQDKSLAARKLFTLAQVSLNEMLHAQLCFAQELAATPDKNGQKVLFGGEIGEAVLQNLRDFLNAGNLFPCCSPPEYSKVFNKFFRGIRVRKAYGFHPRLHILEPSQAQLEAYDCVILGSLNANTWPGQHYSDLWFSQEMRKSCGLPTFAHQAGYEVLNFIHMLNSPQVILTRARKAGGALLMPSPWLQRLQTVFKILGLEAVLKPPAPWQQWQHQLDAAPQYLSIECPAPQPPAQFRPHELSVTDVERLMADPYVIYARKILGLAPLPSLEPAFDNALFGNIVHKALNRFHTLSFPDDQALQESGERLFLPFKTSAPVFYGFYWPRFTLLAQWIYQQYIEEKDNIALTYTEVPGFLDLATNCGAFRLKAVADRIDLMKDGSLRIIDYKTGQLPAMRQIQDGERPQLLLEALIAERGAFKGVPKGPLKSVELWQLGRHGKGGEKLGVENDLPILIEKAHQQLIALLNLYNCENIPYKAAWKALPNSPYSHLSRRLEWSIVSL